jgi:surfeit locus 1 family protein
MESMSDLPVLSLNEGQGVEKFRVVGAAGHYLPGETFYVDNMLYEGQPGYHVISLFELENRDSLVLVNRGWIAGLSDRSVLPETDTPLEARMIGGSLVSPRTRPFFMGDTEPEGQKLRLYIDIEKISQRLNRPVLPFVMQLQSDRADGLIRSWPKFDSKVSMHIGYAVQWFAFALFAFLMAIYSCFKKNKPV